MRGLPAAVLRGEAVTTAWGLRLSSVFRVPFCPRPGIQKQSRRKAFVHTPGVPEMMRTYRRTVGQLEDVLQNAGANSVFEARVYEDLCFVARANAMGA